MSSGFLGDDSDYSSPGNEENMYPTKNWVKFSLDLPMQKDKTIGKDFAYFTAGIVVLGDVIHKSVPEGLVSYADKKLFAPLDIINYKWQYTPQKVGNTAGGIQLRAIDFAKYGQLYKNKGLWNGIQILNKEWVEKSLDRKVKISTNDEFYGYLFWNKIFKINNKEYEVSYCSGRGGNKIFIFKDIPFVVVITSSAYNSPDAHLNADKMMTDYILPAIIGK
ncbi:serine hydrolase domain-containing protein [Psychroflexus torquis]|uniref:serine hydrolase domain-containing protein n=1 Tax=Psychroflexus torquis TaxID=57029 RepID=UPI0000D543D4|nr:serine hydrolase [Psychroflexus torquis]